MGLFPDFSLLQMAGSLVVILSGISLLARLITVLKDIKVITEMFIEGWKLAASTVLAIREFIEARIWSSSSSSSSSSSNKNDALPGIQSHSSSSSPQSVSIQDASKTTDSTSSESQTRTRTSYLTPRTSEPSRAKLWLREGFDLIPPSVRKALFWIAIAFVVNIIISYKTLSNDCQREFQGRSDELQHEEERCTVVPRPANCPEDLAKNHAERVFYKYDQQTTVACVFNRMYLCGTWNCVEAGKTFWIPVTIAVATVLSWNQVIEFIKSAIVGLAAELAAVGEKTRKDSEARLAKRTTRSTLSSPSSSSSASSVSNNSENLTRDQARGKTRVASSITISATPEVTQ